MVSKKQRLSLALGRQGSSYRRQLDSALTRAEEFLARDFSGNNKQVVRTTPLDERDFRRRANRWPRYHDLVKRGNADYPQFGDMLIDVYFALYQYDPQFRTGEQMAPSHRLNRDLIQQAMALDLWDQARTNGLLNQGQAIIGLVYIAQAILDGGLTDEVKKRAAALAERQKDQDTRAERLKKLLEQYEKDGVHKLTPEEIKALEEKAGEATDITDEEAALAEQIMQQLLQELDGVETGEGEGEEEADAAAEAFQSSNTGGQVRRALRKGLEGGVGAQNQLSNAIASWGEDMGSWNALPLEERMALADRMQSLPHLKDFVDMVGRMERVMLDAKMQPNAREAEEITDVDSGGRMEEVIPSERILLAHPLLKKIFYAKLAQEMLLVNQYAGKDETGKGPMIILIDVSGSTQGTKERWGKGFAMAAIEMCRREGRDAGIAFFDTVIHPNGTFVFPMGRAPSGISNLAQKVQVAEYYTGGGTAFEGPLSFALDQIEDKDGEWSQADIVMITDGICQVRPEWNEQFRARCQARQIKVHSILLDLGGHYLETVKMFSDQAYAVSTFAKQSHSQATPIFSGLVT